LGREWTDDIIKDGVVTVQTYTHSASVRRTDENRGKLSLRHWTDTTGTSTWNEQELQLFCVCYSAVTGAQKSGGQGCPKPA